MNISTSQKEALVIAAREAMKSSYSPYSDFSVGAALLTADGDIYSGCNIENSAFTPTVCAERVAIFKAVSDGKKHFVAIAIIGGKNGIVTSQVPPCGVCRQVMREFCDDDFIILLASNTSVSEYTLKDMLPHSFSL